MLVKMAWRNLWRNKLRSAITMLALAAGVACVIMVATMQESAFGQMVDLATSGLLGDMQIHGNGYQDDPEIGTVVHNPAAVEAKLARALPGSKAVRRALGFGLAGTEDNAMGVMIVGMQPDREGDGGLVSVVKGRNLAAKPAGEAIIGSGLGEQLEIEPGGEIVLLSQAADGSLANDRYTVVGLVDAGNKELSDTAVFLQLDDAQEFFALEDGVHQILVHLDDEQDDDIGGAVATLRGALDLTTLEALSWSEIVPELKGMIEEKKKGRDIISFIVILIVGLGIFNTMAMSTFERTKEFGVMASVGTRPRRILGLVLAEALLQGAIALALGVVIAAIVIQGVSPLEYAAKMTEGGDMMGLSFPAKIHLELSVEGVKLGAVTAVATVLFGALWPAWRASRLKPAQAVRYA